MPMGCDVLYSSGGLRTLFWPNALLSFTVGGFTNEKIISHTCVTLKILRRLSHKKLQKCHQLQESRGVSRTETGKSIHYITTFAYPNKYNGSNFP